jgi:hypothetical protein
LATQCPSGFYANFSRAVACQICPVGHRCEDRANDPIPCVAGTYSSSFGTCLPCADGYYSLEASSICSMCPSGHSCQDSSLAPVPCAEGSFSEAGSLACTACQKGTFSAAGSSCCQPCPPGFVFVDFFCPNLSLLDIHAQRQLRIPLNVRPVIGAQEAPSSLALSVPPVIIAQQLQRLHCRVPQEATRQEGLIYAHCALLATHVSHPIHSLFHASLAFSAKREAQFASPAQRGLFGYAHFVPLSFI